MKVPTRLKFCAERGRLVDALYRATDQYATITNQAVRELGAMAMADYALHRDNAKVALVRAREALVAHRAEHGC